MTSFPKTIKMNVGEIEAVDIPTMQDLSDDEYRNYIRDDGLVLVDHHEVLRSSAAGNPLAVNLEQLDILIDELQSLRGKMVSRSA